ncbi:beta-phosphoglucomutase family hydrolase [Mycolicibacterium mageritense DSM 44476 = CIP 104973]|uniref:Haloacid dehalogenase n=1 Tax=Mycolicibacterium mageritense TaxID=53462 RepID=A0ABM7HKF5_MYCME|nr:HAD-IA family hydrolase [Mycolicibacterium mageritense]BBX30971.1 haloacid dehalogenase [Mycolicibacterium mageritense]CDO24721.1 hydrolase [Mycolicibacterium mageritense DSM 44476 = CIP 104973]
MKLSDCDAVLFDLDGVLTDTAAVHEKAWAALFTELFANPEICIGEPTPYSTADYFKYIDGKPRNQGVLAVLASRGIELPLGGLADEPSRLTVNGLGNRKNGAFLAAIDADGVRPYPGSSDVLEWLAAQSIPRAVVSSSRNAEAVLGAAGLRDLIDVVIDGNEASVLGLPGKPAPDTYLRAAEVLCAVPERTIVVEDAVSGVAAGRAGGFWVVGIDRGAGGNNLFENGADTVIADLAEMFGLETPSKPL